MRGGARSTASGFWALVPCKRFEAAKQRLRPVLSESARRQLLAAMLHDVLSALGAARSVSAIAVVTSDREAASIARSYDAVVLADPLQGGLCGAIGAAVHALSARGVEDVLIVPSDLPAVRSQEIDALAAALPRARPGVVIAPDRALRGTNALLAAPARAMKFRFGLDSFRRHLAVAREQGLIARRFRAQGLALDIDTADELAILLEQDPASRAAALLRALPEADFSPPTPSVREVKHDFA